MTQTVSRGRTRRRPRPVSPLRERLRDSFWFAPVLGLLGAIVFSGLTTAADKMLVELLRDAGESDAIDNLLKISDDAKRLLNTVGSSMLTFIGVVFSISLVALQMAASQFTPRVLRLYVRSRITKATFAVFLATFTFALLAQLGYETDTDPATVTSVPVVSGAVGIVLVMISLLLFIAYVHSTLRLMRVTQVIDRVARESLAVLGGHALLAVSEERAVLPPVTGEIVYSGPAGVLRGINVGRLTRLARRYDAVLRLEPRIGDFIVTGTPVCTVHGGTFPADRRRLRSAFQVGVERTFHQDLGFGLRQLSDIALRALSPALNDPTTAVQALDRIHQLLAALVARPLGEVHHRDRSGTLRLVQQLPRWPDLLDLALVEIRGCGSAAPQVTRRMFALLDDLLLSAPEERRASLLRHRALLVQSVARAQPDPADREFSVHPDRQGIG
ncbi:DUF2254 domain-containing protein [Streptomyces sp. NPDC004647]|uniref:DUF2254 domain-containing protein n=1 Tax=Streptomyces sp. NPDC004647 TaxID=3154671 RepID=UPI0033BD1027